MASNIYSTGLRNVGSYQVSGTPWVTGSLVTGGSANEVKVSFPYVAKSLYIKISATTSGNTQDMRISLASFYQNNAGTNQHWVTGFKGREYTFTGKFKEIYFSLNNAAHESEFEMVAELTNIPASHMYTLTGSGVDE